MYRTPRLVIREWTEDPGDLARILDVYSRWEVARWLGATPRAMSSPDQARAAAVRWREQYRQWGGRYGAWAIEVSGTGTVAGTVLLKPLPSPDGQPGSDGQPGVDGQPGPDGQPGVEVEVGWHLHPDSWRHGYATEAARGAIAHGFAAGLDAVYAVVYPDNAASLAVCRRLELAPLGRTDRWYGVELEAFVTRAPGPATGPG